MTGEIVSVLYTNHVKQLKKVPGLWPPEFAAAASSDTMEENGNSDETKEKGEEVDTLADSLSKVDINNDNNSSDGIESDSDDGLPPLEQIQNRRVVVYDVSSSESESEEDV